MKYNNRKNKNIVKITSIEYLILVKTEAHQKNTTYIRKKKPKVIDIFFFILFEHAFFFLYIKQFPSIFLFRIEQT